MAMMSMGAAMAWLSEQAPDTPAISCEGETISRSQLDASSNRLARSYQHLGVVQDSFVTIALPNGIEFYQACLAVWKLGATPQPVSYRLPFTERQDIIDLVKPSLVVGVEPGSHGSWPCIPTGFEPDADLSDEAFKFIAAKHWKAPTSGGSTGRPKIIVAGEPAFIDPEAVQLRGMQPNGCQLVPGPLYHNAPFAFSCKALLSGNHLVVLKRFDALETLRCIQQYKIDWLMLVPTMMLRIWRLEESERLRYDLSSLNSILHLAAPCPAWLKEEWINWLGGEVIQELYAGTEAQVATWISGTEWLAHRGSVGRPMSGELKIMDEQGNDLPARQIGLVYMRAASGLGSTYKYIGAETESIGDWETLGDMGSLDEDGFLYLADRRTDMIISGGANIYPAEVEAAIDAHEAVRSCAVIGLPDEDLGQRVHAIVDIADKSLEEEALLAYLSDALARYKIPRQVEFVTETVRDDAGKVRRQALREQRMPS